MRLAAVAPWFIAVTGAADAPLRLLMFDDPDCGYCRQWDEEVGVVYARTHEGRMAPLVRTPLDGAAPPAVLKEPVRYTPTFVLVRGGHEVGRITGYPGEDGFWGLLGALLRSSISD